MSPGTQLALPAWRVVATRNPPVHLFEAVAPPEAFDALVDLELAFSPHHNQLKLLEAGLPRSEWVFGPGAGYIMAPFVYRSPSRFSDGSYGVFYAGLEEATAIQEVAHHRARFLRATEEGPMFLQEAILTAGIQGTFTDVRGARRTLPHLFGPDPATYPVAQAWAAAQRASGVDGLAYPSVRRPGGTCVAAFRPSVVHSCRLQRMLRFWWDGSEVMAVP